jgi:hypothetical protein
VDRHAVSCIDAQAVDLDGARRRHQVAIAGLAELIFGGFAGLQRRRHHAGVGADRQCLGVRLEAAGDGDETAGAIRLRKRLRTPARLAAGLGGLDPDLEDPRRAGLEIVFGVAHAGAGTHYLNIASLGAALVAQTVLMRDGALADVSDDFHIGVRMRREAGVRRDLVVIPNPQGTVAHIIGVIVTAEREMVLGLEPAVVGATKLVERSKFDHDEISVGDVLEVWISRL